MSKFGIEPLTPAYGRDYKSAEALLIDWQANKDFTCSSGQYTNKADLETAFPKGTTFTFRYGKMKKQFVITL